MCVLLIDLGNTALKWCLLGDSDNPHTVVHRGHSNFQQELFNSWLNMRPERVIGCSVAAPEIAFAATKFFNDHHIKWEWVRPQARFESEAFTLDNLYANYAQLGSDRWNAAIGAIDSNPCKSLVIVQMGTAATVDCVHRVQCRHYRFLGGRITPGPTLMRDSLRGVSKNLGGEGCWEQFPTNTENAITTGLLDAMSGMVLLAYEELKQLDPLAEVLLAGGASQFLAPRLSQLVPTLRVHHNLVLKGLEARARLQLLNAIK